MVILLRAFLSTLLSSLLLHPPTSKVIDSESLRLRFRLLLDYIAQRRGEAFNLELDGRLASSVVFLDKAERIRLITGVSCNSVLTKNVALQFGLCAFKYLV